ncbi:ABC transporter substrate-binding protein [Hydrogenophaga sp. PBL-H3]|uniref:ABC transporter substrate-binding protein n=1 Tax=Hydrogenophaga sp. PBL-H3 TaxID=434010 RepID=UPI00132016A6|nr:ABC transporter substrate-binding protein [Hydrogenophaga sp. PBL-H3]QHE76635.1 ABC transporter substrate-binding protein [Hydrogenophaga sp. PBL-H3]QHE81059.1 ABC transporter substrate-binding protein [Hydrogenophaga sp. PBL-H3]
MLKRRDWGRAVAAAALAAGLPELRAQPVVPPAAPLARSAPKLVIAVDNRTDFSCLPLTIADRLGYFASEGVDVEVRDFADASQAMQALLSGAVHAVSAHYSSTIAWQVRGHSLQSFVLQGRTPQIVVGVSTKTFADYRQLSDLRGKRVGVQAFGSPAHRVARAVFNRGGLRSDDVQFVALPNAWAAISAFRNGALDAISYTDPTMTQLEQAGELKVVADTRSVRGNADVFGGPMPSACLCATSGFLTQFPRASQSMADAMVHALKWLQTAGPSDLIKVVPERYFQGDRSLYLAAFNRAREAWSPDGLMPEAGPEIAARLVAQFDEPGSMDRFDLPSTFTNVFARKAKARFRA